MLFFKKKKQKRDREAGLVFRWRGVRKHHLGKFVALGFAASLFVFLAYSVRIEGMEQRLLSKETGTVIYLDPDDSAIRKLMFDIEEQSPFPARWDPAQDRAHLTKISNMVNEVVGKPWMYEAELIPVPMKGDTSSSLASIVDTNTGLLSGLRNDWQDTEVSPELPVVGDLFVRAHLRASRGLADRLNHQEWSLPAHLVSEDWFGQSFRFLVSIDSEGVVRSCLLLPGGSMGVIRAGERQQELGVWIRGQRFKQQRDQEEPLVTGELELQMDATRE